MDKLEEIPDVPSTFTCESLGYHTDEPLDGQEYEQIPVRGLLCYALKLKTKGFLEISSTPNAEIWILGEKQAQKTPTIIPLEQGTYDITLKAEGYFDETIRVWLDAQQTIIRAITLTPKDAPEPTTRLARISVNSFPTGAKILVNGDWTKSYTPDNVLLKAGDYEIGLTKTGFFPWSTPLRLVEES